QKGIKSGDRVRVRSKRGMIEVLALVTKRLGPTTIDGKQVFQVGIPIHWGFVGVSADADPSKGAHWLANALTPFVGDANAYTPEIKGVLVNLEKISSRLLKPPSLRPRGRFRRRPRRTWP